MNRDRLEGRVQRLLDARAKMLARLEGAPKHAKASAWKVKLKAYDTSMANFQEYGQETVPTNNPVGVSIDVPKGTFKIVDHSPAAKKGA